MEAMLDLSLVIACYNEGGYLEKNLLKILKVLETTTFNYEIIFVDDASKDETKEIVIKICNNYNGMHYLFHDKNMGRGKAVTDGIKIAKGRVAGFIDIDLETAPGYIPWLVKEVLDGADIACAWRIYKAKINSLHRWILNRGYNFLVRKVLGLEFRDTETGCKFFNREKILPVLNNVLDNHWFWDTEIIARAYIEGLKIVEIPTLYIRKTDKKSSVRIVKDTIYYLKKLFWLRQELKRLK